MLSTLYIPQTSYLAKSLCGTRFGTGIWEWGRLSFHKSGCRRDKALSRSCAGLQKESVEKVMGLTTGRGSCRPGIWGLAEQRGQEQEAAENWELKHSGHQQPGKSSWECRVKKREGVERGSIWDKEPAGKCRDESTEQRQMCERWEQDKHKGRRNLAAEE